MKNFSLFLIAYTLLLPLTIFNYVVVVRAKDKTSKGYFRSTAVNIDRFGNREFRATWNKYLRKENGYAFGDERETISSVLGKNERDGTLTKCGQILCKFLNKIDKNHCSKSINDDISHKEKI
ncbi:hypothetical protein [Ornithobacterium rhinotracheale]|uniref:hypothetical protein n=2 Tax=Ornithobacterium rhinotracheale TaxID=28251 RepID=UPI00403718BD